MKRKNLAPSLFDVDEVVTIKQEAVSTKKKVLPPVEKPVYKSLGLSDTEDFGNYIRNVRGNNVKNYE